MGEHRIIRRRFDGNRRAVPAAAGNSKRLGGGCRNRRINAVLFNPVEAQTQGMEVQVLRNRVMVVILIRTVVGGVGMVGVGMVRRMRLGVDDVGVPMRSDLKQVQDSQDQGCSRP